MYTYVILYVYSKRKQFSFIIPHVQNSVCWDEPYPRAPSSVRINMLQPFTIMNILPFFFLNVFQLLLITCCIDGCFTFYFLDVSRSTRSSSTLASSWSPWKHGRLKTGSPLVMMHCLPCATSWNTGRRASRNAVTLCTSSRGFTLTILCHSPPPLLPLLPPSQLILLFPALLLLSALLELPLHLHFLILFLSFLLLVSLSSSLLLFPVCLLS